MRRAIGAWALMLGGLGAAGCTGPMPQDVAVSWLLADGRSCIDAAVLSVTIAVSGDRGPDGGTLTSACPADVATVARVLVPGVIPGVQLQAQGLSSSGTVLYRGQLTLPDPLPPALDLTLYFTGGE